MLSSAKITSLAVIDPCNRTGKINIPMSVVTETKGVKDFIKCGGHPPPDVKDLSLCLLFQKGRCNAGSRCNQVHAAPEFIRDVRLKATAGRTCCARHGDVHSAHLQTGRPVQVVTDGRPSAYLLSDFAVTPALEQLVSKTPSGPLRVQASRICRLHRRNACKFGKDCKNLHLCGDAAPQTDSADVQPPALGLAFRALETDSTGVVSGNSSYIASTVADSVGFDPCASTVKPLSVVSIMDELQSLRRDDRDPLDIDVDNDSSCSGVSATDFHAFVDALVHSEVQPMESPQWLSA